MITVTLDELTVNAITAALDNRVAQMRQQQKRLREIRAILKAQPHNARALRENEFAMEATDDAIRDAIRATLTIAAALPDPEYPADMTVVGLFRPTEAESRALWGDR